MEEEVLRSCDPALGNHDPALVLKGEEVLRSCDPALRNHDPALRNHDPVLKSQELAELLAQQRGFGPPWLGD